MRQLLRQLEEQSADRLGEETVWPGQDTIQGDARGLLPMLKMVLATAVGRFAMKRVHETVTDVRKIPSGVELSWTGRIDPVSDEIRLFVQAERRKIYGPFYWKVGVERGGKLVDERKFGPTAGIEHQGSKWLANAVREMALEDE
jgi:hypothetical protein